MHLEVVPITKAIVVGFTVPLVVGLVPEPVRKRSMAITVSVAAGAYLNGGFGIWEFVFAVAVGVCGYFGLRSYKATALGWLLHTAWDVAHHAADLPMISWLPTSSLECAVSDTFFALWFIASAPGFGDRLFPTQNPSPPLDPSHPTRVMPDAPDSSVR